MMLRLFGFSFNLEKSRSFLKLTFIPSETRLRLSCFWPNSLRMEGLEDASGEIIVYFFKKLNLNVTWWGGANFLSLHNPFRKKIAFWYPVSEFLYYKTIGKQYENNRKTIAYCCWTNSNNPFRNFWSIFMPRSGIYAETWYPEKRHVQYRFISKCPPPPGSHLLHGCDVIQTVHRRTRRKPSSSVQFENENVTPSVIWTYQVFLSPKCFRI